MNRVRSPAALSDAVQNGIAAVRLPPLGVPGDQRCRVEVRFWSMGGGFYHAYIVTSDRHRATQFRAGPAHPSPTGRIRALLAAGSSAATASLRGFFSSGPPDQSNLAAGAWAPKARHWGPLRADHGPYVAGTLDYDSGRPPTMPLVVDGAPCGLYDLRLTGAEIALNSASLPYNPLSTNSNAFVRYALTWIHVTPGAPPVWAPGWDTILRP